MQKGELLHQAPSVWEWAGRVTTGRGEGGWVWRKKPYKGLAIAGAVTPTLGGGKGFRSRLHREAGHPGPSTCDVLPFQVPVQVPEQSFRQSLPASPDPILEPKQVGGRLSPQNLEGDHSKQ